MSSHETLGLLLVRDGLITRPQLYDALRLQRQNNRLLGTCLLSLGYIAPERLLDILAKQLSIPALPPGTLSRASPEALSRVPADLAVRLRIVPYSWDGEMLGVAVADGRALNHLHEVSFFTQSAVGAYVALEAEIEAVLRKLYPQEAKGLAATTVPAPAPFAAERPRPARAAPLSEVPTRDFGAALGLDSDPVELGLRKPILGQAVIRGAPPRAAVRGPPPPVRRPTLQPATEVERVAFYDAVEHIYEAKTLHELGRHVASALLNYFSRVLILGHYDGALHTLAYAGVQPVMRFAMSDLTTLQTSLAERSIAYGLAAGDPRGAELRRAFGVGEAATSLIAPVATSDEVRLIVYADNEARADLYDDLHDVELLIKEAETALGLMQPPAVP